MSRLHLFNPDNDLALAADIDNYTPPKAALRFRRDAELLPLWYGEQSDRVVCHGVNAEWLDTRRESFPALCDIHDHRQADLSPTPWGWSKATRQSFMREGVPAGLLPDDAGLDRIRLLSHRSTASRVHRQLQVMLPDIRFPHPAQEVHSTEDVERLMARWGDIYVKQPWSGSGRGVISSVGKREAALRLAQSFIGRQGSAMVEPAMHRVRDFAMLFRCTDGKVGSIGTSVFTTDDSGHYSGNLLAPEAQRFAEISSIYPAQNLIDVRTALCHILQDEIAPYYSGVVGVDMLVSSDGILHPVVEINLRHTMGYVANEFSARHLHPDARGRFRVVPFKSQSDLPAENFQVADGRLLSGCLHLCPTPVSGFAVIAEVGHQ